MRERAQRPHIELAAAVCDDRHNLGQSMSRPLVVVCHSKARRQLGRIVRPRALVAQLARRASTAARARSRQVATFPRPRPVVLTHPARSRRSMAKPSIRPIAPAPDLSLQAQHDNAVDPARFPERGGVCLPCLVKGTRAGSEPRSGSRGRRIFRRCRARHSSAFWDSKRSPAKRYI